MDKHKVSIIGVMLIIAGGFWFGIKYLSDKKISLPNGFNRQWINEKVVFLHRQHHNNLVAISGNTPANIYFSTNSPDVVAETSISLSSIKYYQLPHSKNINLQQLFTAFVDSPDVVILCHQQHLVIRGRLNEKTTMDQTLSCPPFLKSVFIRQNSFVTKCMDTNYWDMQIRKVLINADSSCLSDILPMKKKSGGFLNDGHLDYDPIQCKLSYVNFYNNQFVVFDTFLNVLFHGKTIDTSRVADISVRTFTKGNHTKFMNSSPPRQVNNNSFSFEGNLYVLSNLKADNEPLDSFRKNMVIDKYHMDDGQYAGSFYLPKTVEGPLIDIKMITHQLCVVLFPHDVIIYKLSL